MKNKFLLGLVLVPFLFLATACGDDDPATPEEPANPLVGVWQMSPVEGAMKVGPQSGSAEWFQTNVADVTTRACYFDDTFEFTADGNFIIELGTETWLETFQGVNQDECGSPVAPFVSATHTYTYNETAQTLTVNGRGAYLGLQKVNEEGEISQGAAVADQITYNVQSLSESNMELRIEAADGVHWTFLLSKNN